jgi:hypothetical protein
VSLGFQWKEHFQFYFFRYWLFGERIINAQTNKIIKNSKSAKKRRLKGWFPRQCALELVDFDLPPGDWDTNGNNEGDEAVEKKEN